MIAYKEIAQIKNVWGINPITGGYSYEENGRGYLCIDSVLLEKEEPVLDIVSVGDTSMCGMVVGALSSIRGTLCSRYLRRRSSFWMGI